MTFIYKNKNLIDELVKASSVFEKKYAQDSATIPDSMDNYLSLSKKLVDNLEKIYFPARKDPNAPAQIGTEADTEVELSDVNLENLGALVNFLTSQKVTVDGKRISYSGTEKPQDESYQLLSLEPNTGGLENSERTATTSQNYVNKDLLFSYIRHLQGTAIQKKNKVQEVMIGRIIEEANRDLNAKLDKQYKEKEFVLANDQVLDQFQQVLDPKMYSVDGGPKILTYADIQSDTSFNSWLAKAPIAATPLPPKYVDFNNPDFDICIAIKTVYLRAKYLLLRSTSEELKKRNQAYVAQVTKLSTQLTGKDGTACQLNEPSADNTTNEQNDQEGNESNTENSSYKQVKNRTRGRTALTTQDLRKFLNRFPLLEDRIDFQRIKNFVAAYAQITGQNPAAITTINTELNNITNSFRVGNAQGFPTSADEIARILPKGVHPYSYFSSLYTLVVNVKQLLNYLKSVNYDYMDDQLKEQIDQQVGTGTNDGSAIAVQNLADLQDYMREAQNWRRTS